VREERGDASAPSPPAAAQVLADAVLAITQVLARPDATSETRVVEIVASLDALAPDVQNQQFVQALLDCAHYFQLSANSLRSVPLCVRATEAARRINDRALLRKSLTFLGAMYVDVGNLPAATTSYAEAMDLAQGLGDWFAQCVVLNLLGSLLMNAAQYADALACFERVHEIVPFGSNLPASFVDALNSNTALAALRVKDIAKAYRAINTTPENQSELPKSIENQTRSAKESIFVRVLLELGDVDRARERASLAVKYAEESGLPKAEVLAAISQGLADIDAGYADVGLTRLKRALENARANVKGLLSEALSACVTGYERAKQPDVALVYLHELLTLNKEARGAQVLVHHRRHLKAVDPSSETAKAADLAFVKQQSDLRTQLTERDLMRNRILMLEEQSVAAELHDDTTGEHCYRVGRMSSLLAKEFGLEDDVCFLIDLAARMHDIGKLMVPDAILLKPGRLTDGEREIMEKHTTAGAEILGKSDIPQMYVAEEIALHHHERWDGSGYPHRLKGTAIPIAARITAVADVFDALTHVRPYKHAWPIGDALREIRAMRGKHFDPQITDLFLALVPRLITQHGDLDDYLGQEARKSPFIQARRKIAEVLKGSDPSKSIFELRR
jgi:putative two-component system response regulator